MKREELKELESLLSELGRVHQRLSRDLKKATDLTQKVKDLLVDHMYERRIAEKEERFLREALRQVREQPVIRKLSRRLQSFEREVQKEEDVEQKISKRTKVVGSKLERLKNYLKELDS